MKNSRNFRMIVLPMLLLSFVPASCGEETQKACTMMAVASVTVYTETPAGIPIEPDSVTYSVDGGKTQSAECFSPEEPCVEWIAGWELPGEFTITATLGGYSDTKETLVAMAPDGCHVEQQSVALILGE